jgi:hypothetical protein
MGQPDGGRPERAGIAPGPRPAQRPQRPVAFDDDELDIPDFLK